MVQPCCANAGSSFSMAWKSGEAPQSKDQYVSVLMVTSTAPFPTYEQFCGKTKSTGINDADATGDADALGEAEAVVGVDVAADNVDGMPHAHAIRAATSRNAVARTCTILRPPGPRSMTKR